MHKVEMNQLGLECFEMFDVNLVSLLITLSEWK